MDERGRLIATMVRLSPAIIDRVAELCARHGVARLDLTGSAARDDFDPRTSDIDMLVEVLTGARVSAFDFVGLSASLEVVFECRVDLIELDAVTNPILREAFVRDRMPFYAAA
jgi:predicted nucleotidyltransferase